ncbi:MAG: hypothetical protein AB7F35_30075, partial [Acetobacteraceae bacterium]
MRRTIRAVSDRTADHANVRFVETRGAVHAAGERELAMQNGDHRRVLFCPASVWHVADTIDRGAIALVRAFAAL